MLDSAGLIAVATAQKVRGLTTKGKVAFSIETNLVEPIQHMQVPIIKNC